MFDKLVHMDRRVIYGVVFLSLTIPLIWPIGLGVVVGPETKQLYDMVEALPSGSAVIVSMDTSPGGYGELSSGSLALLNHLAEKGIRVIGMGFFDTGPSLLETALGGSKFRDKEYGVDYVNLGYLAGGETAMAKVAKDILGSFPRDYRGNVTSDLPVMKGITSCEDISLIISISSGTPGVPEWIRQVGDPLGVPIATVIVAVNVPNMTPYVQSGQIVGMIPSMKGAAGYESLMGTAGLGTRGMDAQSISHLTILGLVVLGNVVYFATKNTKPSEGGAH